MKNMGNKFTWFFVFVIALQFAACGKTFKTQSGSEYRFVEGKPLDSMLGPNYMVLMKHMILGPDGDTIQNTFAIDSMEERPYPVQTGTDVREVIQKMSEGSMVELYVPTDSLKKISGHIPQVAKLPDGKRVTFVIKVFKIMDFEAYDVYRNTKRISQIMAENKLIDDYAAKHGKGWLLDSSMMIKFRIWSNTSGIKQPDGTMVQDYLTDNSLLKNAPIHKGALSVVYHVEVTTIDGNPIINSLMEGRKYKSTYQENFHDIPALNILPFYVPKGKRAEFLVISDHGYGAAGRLGVPSYAPLRIIIDNVEAAK